jgi:hypothetical protein
MVRHVRFDDQLVGHKPDEPAAVGVCAALGLPGAIPLVLRQRDPDGTDLSRIELVHATRHPGWELPPRVRRGIEERAVDALPRR